MQTWKAEGTKDREGEPPSRPNLKMVWILIGHHTIPRRGNGVHTIGPARGRSIRRAGWRIGAASAVHHGGTGRMPFAAVLLNMSKNFTKITLDIAIVWTGVGVRLGLGTDLKLERRLIHSAPRKTSDTRL